MFKDAKELTAPVPSKVALNCGIYEIYRRGDSRVSDSYLPEPFLMVSVNDKLLPASGVLKEKLEENSVPYEYHEYGQSNPADGHVFHVNLRSAEGRRCNKEELAFFLKNEQGIFKESKV